jgi:hypothetical protein
LKEIFHCETRRRGNVEKEESKDKIPPPGGKPVGNVENFVENVKTKK